MGRRLGATFLLPALLLSAVVTGCAAVTVQQTTLKQTYTDGATVAEAAVQSTTHFP